MVQNTFEAKEVVLGKLFNNDYLFRMPIYQRPYSWTPEETEELLNDLLGAMDEEKTAQPYFLGSIVLIARPHSAVHEVLDGQQRLTTLTMLFCVLRELTDEDDKRISLDRRVRETRDVFAGGRDRFRLEIRERDQDFFRDNVQTPAKISNFIDHGAEHALDSRKLIFDNTEFLYSELSKLSQDKRDALSEFVISQCYLVVVSAYDRDSAHRIFSILNARGLDLTPTDILKSDVIGEIPGKVADKYNKRWEDIEDELGREQFRELFAHIFVIETGNRFHRELAKAFKENVLENYTGTQFVDEPLVSCIRSSPGYSEAFRADRKRVFYLILRIAKAAVGNSYPANYDYTTLVRYAEAFRVVTSATYESAKHAEDVNRMLIHLSRIDNDDWIPVAMVFYDKYKSAPATLLALLKDLDRLAYAMFVTGVRRDPRILRYRPVINVANRDEPALDEVFEYLQLAPEERRGVVSLLNEPVYRPRPVARFARPLLLRLDSVLADANVSYDHKIITVEHVLPQTPEPSSEWVKNFPDEDERDDWTHRLANLVLLSRSKNASAQNYDFDRKKKEYFQKGGVAGFALTTQVVNEKSWTPRVLERRQKKLIEALETEWRLVD